jgi:uncharacterized protein YjbI with pentapeptide repeats
MPRIVCRVPTPQSLAQPERCDYRFVHPQRPRDSCGLPVGTSTADGRHLCPLHGPANRHAGFSLRDWLEEQVSAAHWLEGVDLSGQDLQRASLYGARLPSANLAEANLDDADLSAALMDGAVLADASIQRVNLADARLTDARLDRARLNGANLTKTDLTDASLTRCDLSGATLEATVLAGTWLRGIRLNTETSIMDGDVDLRAVAEFGSGHYQDAARVFRELSAHSRDTSDHRSANEYYSREMTALHLEAVGAPPLRTPDTLRLETTLLAGLARVRTAVPGIGWAINRWLWGYGVRPSKVLVWMTTVILVFGLLVFPHFGVSQAGSGSNSAATVTHDRLTGLTLRERPRDFNASTTAISQAIRRALPLH